MRMLRGNGNLRLWLAGGLMVAGALSGARPVRAADTIAPLGTTPSAPATTADSAAPQQFTPGIAELLKLIDSGVGPEALKAYIKTSSVAYNPSAQEIILLKQRGLSDEVLVAVMQHGAELRAQAAQVAQAAQAGQASTDNYSTVSPSAPSAAVPYAQTPGYGSNYGTYGGMAPYPDYASGYTGYPYGYAYGYGYPYSYGYGYPWFTPGIVVGFGFNSFGHGHFHNNFVVHNHFNHFAFHNGQVNHFAFNNHFASHSFAFSSHGGAFAPAGGFHGHAMGGGFGGHGMGGGHAMGGHR